MDEQSVGMWWDLHPSARAALRRGVAVRAVVRDDDECNHQFDGDRRDG